ncbi:hypothetical protein ACJX0J_014851, partial [Zea mays]
FWSFYLLQILSCLQRKIPLMSLTMSVMIIIVTLMKIQSMTRRKNLHLLFLLEGINHMNWHREMKMTLPYIHGVPGTSKRISNRIVIGFCTDKNKQKVLGKTWANCSSQFMLTKLATHIFSFISFSLSLYKPRAIKMIVHVPYALLANIIRDTILRVPLCTSHSLGFMQYGKFFSVKCLTFYWNKARLMTQLTNMVVVSSMIKSSAGTKRANGQPLLINDQNKYKSMLTHTYSTVWMIGGFAFIIYMGHLYI